ncbi:MAG: DUF1573 domain-containing protein [Bacteroidota bacterium]
MFKVLKSALFALLAVALLSSCADEKTAAQQEAEQAVQAVQPEAATPAPTPAAAATPAVPAGPTTTITFAETEFNFGTVTEGEKVSHTYSFTNTGAEPLILSNAKGSCGCTVPQWPKEPIAPGESGEITVEFNSKNKKGQRNQKVTVTANTNPAQTVILLKGNVEPGAETEVKVAQ